MTRQQPRLPVADVPSQMIWSETIAVICNDQIR